MTKTILLCLFLPLLGQAQTDSTVSEQNNIKNPVLAPKSTVSVWAQPQIWAYSTNFTQALSIGQTGVQTYSSGAPGSDISILVRGNADPLFRPDPAIMVDGMPFFGDNAALNTYDIESITVEKMPADFSFPTRMTHNGIIHIQTKKAAPRPLPWRLNLNVNAGFNTPALPQYDLITDPGQYYETLWQGVYNQMYTLYGDHTQAAQMASQNLVRNYAYGHNAYNVPDNELIDPQTGKLNPNAQLQYKDNWRKAVQRLGVQQQYQLSARKSGKKAGILLSGNYLKEDGYMIRSSFERMGTHIHTYWRPLQGMNISLSGMYSHYQDQDILSGPAYINPFFALFNTGPIHPLYQRDAQGQIIQDPATGAPAYADYPDNVYLIPQLNAFSNFVNYRNLYLNPSVRYTLLPGLELAVSGSYMRRKQSYSETPDDSMSITQNTVIMPQLNYVTYWNQHTLKASAGYTNMYAKKQGYNIPVGLSSHGSILDRIAYQSAHLKTTYQYRNQLEVKATLQKTLRSAIQYTPANSWDWATKASWRHQLSGMQLKYTAGYGHYRRALTIFGNSVDNRAYILLSPNQQGISMKQLDLGIELSNKRERIHLYLNGFRRQTENALQQVYFSSPNPQYYAVEGLGLRNSGLELTLQTRLTRPSARLSWDLGLFASHIHTIITDMYDTYALQTPGQTLNRLRLPQYAGVDPQTGKALYYKQDNSVTDDYRALTLEDYREQASPEPIVFGSVTNQLQYKKLNVQVALAYSLGGKAYDSYYAALMGGDGNNYHKDMLNSWTPEQPNTEVPVYSFTGNTSNAPSSRFMTDASWLSLKYVLLSYRIPIKLYKQSGFNQMSVYASGENLLFFSARKGFNANEAPNTPLFSYQPMRTVRLGVNIDL